MMKTITIKRMLAVVAAVLTVSQAAYAQNYVKETNFLNDNETSIVRVINDNDRVVYTENDSTGVRSFIFYTDVFSVVGSVVVSTQIGVIHHYIKDFVIYDGKIYFCGYRRNTFMGDTVGIIGTLDPSNPGTTSYCEVPGTVQMRKIQVFEDFGKPHAVMIGDGVKGKSVLVDARVNTANDWVIEVYDNSIVENNYYYDLTVTDHYVVVTSRDHYGANYGVIHVFDRPTTYLSITFNPAQYFKTEYKAYGPILIEHRGGDDYATVTNSFLGLGYYYSTYNHVTHISTGEFSFKQCRLLDIKYNRGDRKTDVLVRYPDQGVVRHEIVHHLTGSTVIINSQSTDDKGITSLDWIGGTNYMVASGYSFDNHRLLLYKYHPGIFTCLKERYLSGVNVSNNYTPKEENFDGMKYTRHPYTQENGFNGHQITILCN